MNSELRAAILGNTFTDSLLEYQLDEQAFTELCGSLEQLASVWQGERLVDKELVMHIYHTTHIARNRAEHFRENRQTVLSDRLNDMFIEIDKLFGERCLRIAEAE